MQIPKSHRVVLVVQYVSVYERKGCMSRCFFVKDIINLLCGGNDE